MMSWALLITALTAVFSTVHGLTIESRAVIPHDHVIGFPQTVPDTTIGHLYLKYKPFLDVAHGCVPFPAVDQYGNTSGGLNPTGPADGGCNKSVGQVYVYSKTHGGKFAIMYAWYMPKDEPFEGIGRHRHEWENAVVWLDDAKDDARFLGMAVSQHGNYDKRTWNPTHPNIRFTGDRPWVKYSFSGVLNHHLYFGDSQGVEQPLIAWESMPKVAQDALSNTNWGAANMPFKDKDMDNNLQKAAL